MYFVLEITTVNGQTAKAVWEHETHDAAKSHFYQIMAAAYANTNLTYALCMIINDRGFSEIMDRIGAEEPEPEEEEELPAIAGE